MLMIITVMRQFLRRQELPAQVHGVGPGSHTVLHRRRMDCQKQDGQRRLAKSVQRNRWGQPAISTAGPCTAQQCDCSQLSRVSTESGQDNVSIMAMTFRINKIMPPSSLTTHTPPHCDFTKRPTQYNLSSRNNCLQGGKGTAQLTHVFWPTTSHTFLIVKRSTGILT